MIITGWDLVDRFFRVKSSRKGIPAVRRRIDAWHAEAERAKWLSPADVKARYATASILGNRRVVFKIKGNDFRLIADINYAAGLIEIRFFGSHGEYDRIDARTV